MLIFVIISTMISSMLIIGMAKLVQIAFSSTSSNWIVIQAQQYAASEAELIKKLIIEKLRKTPSNKVVWGYKQQ